MTNLYIYNAQCPNCAHVETFETDWTEDSPFKETMEIECEECDKQYWIKTPYSLGNYDNATFEDINE